MDTMKLRRTPLECATLLKVWKMRLSWKIIHNTLKALVFSYCSVTAQGKRYTLCGASQLDTPHPPL